ncbi:hypothetical protein BAE44_0005681 [Dichanthelium oligosanthes]|uniref:Disease resistance protein At4g27190-like leucine-rich repeats domain-containing protein n=1 Tax=Dichanthelium oligosanthes TaxID=888268 RepID=A0A1E5W7S4_9POAL|nr:hypothetical protein BAE44_0005681 [Dichanthelium oligosanthes]
MPDGEEGGNCSHCIPHSGQVRVGSSLSDLEITSCPKLKVKPFLPSSLQNLQLSGRSERLLQSPGCECGWELLQDMTALESLEIASSDVLTELPESLRHLTSLRSLHVSWCRAIRMLPEWLGEFQSLQALTIRYCDSLSSLPQSMGHLRSLQELKIDSCGALDQLPEELCSLRKLTIKCLPGLTCLPRMFAGPYQCFPYLEVLTIISCPGIKSLPEAIKGLTSLLSLRIFDCPELKRRYERGTGEDWHLISSIPHVYIP